MYAEFTYTLPDQLIPLANSVIKGFGNPNLKGFVNTDDAKKMHHRSMYLICDLDTIENVDHYSNPSLMVAATENDAVSMYNIIYGKFNGTVLCEVHHACDNIHVVPTGVVYESDIPVRREYPV